MNFQKKEIKKKYIKNKHKITDFAVSIAKNPTFIIPQKEWLFKTYEEAVKFATSSVELQNSLGYNMFITGFCYKTEKILSFDLNGMYKTTESEIIKL